MELNRKCPYYSIISEVPFTIKSSSWGKKRRGISLVSLTQSRQSNWRPLEKRGQGRSPAQVDKVDEDLEISRDGGKKASHRVHVDDRQ